MSSIAESTIGITFARLRSEVQRQMGYADPLSDVEIADIDSMIDSGLRQFYWPNAIKGVEPGHQWSFLSVLLEGQAVATPDNSFLLPDDYANGLTMLNVTDQDGDPIPIVDSQAFLQQKTGGTDLTASTPKTATVYRSAGASATESERYKVEVYPRPTVSTTFSFFYNIIPDMINSSNPYPNGAQVHGETILASCLAVTELRKNEGDFGAFHQVFLERIQSSIAIDVVAKNSLAGTGIHSSVASAITNLSVEFQHLYATVGDALGYGRNSGMYTWDENQEVQLKIDKGLRRFYYPSGTKAHVWSFMQPTATLTTVSGTEDYDLPITVGSVLNDMIFTAQNSYSHVEFVPFRKILELRTANTNSSGRPQKFSIRPKGSDGTAEQVNEVIFWPNPDAVYNLKYSYQVRPDKISASLLYSLAGPEHAETIESACLSAVEDDVKGSRYQEFMINLKSSIESDEDFNQPQTYGYNGNGNSGMANCVRQSQVTTYNNILWD